MITVNSFEALTSKLQEAEQAQSISDDAFRQSLTGWRLSPSIFGKTPHDPFSAEYKAFQLEIYKRLTNREYDVSNEETIFNLEHELQWPYPYGTQSAQTVGGSLMGYGWLIKTINLPAQSRILEIGSGYGSLTTHLARMGYRVTCLDISSSLLEYVKMRTAQFPQKINTICGDMATVEIEDTFDAVIFNASLHHSLEHRHVIRRVNELLSENGMIVFVAEPIFRTPSKYVPYPWGIRLDGMSIWSICRWGWLELGFQKSYFKKLIKNTSLHLTHHNLGISSSTDLWLAAKPDHKYANSELNTHYLRLRYLLQTSGKERIAQLMNRLTSHK